jgi:hypothetical protein
MCRLAGKDVAALASQTAQERDQGVPPHWNNYITVADVEEAAPRIAELDGNLLMPPLDVLEAGRMALGTDPTGAAFALWEARDHIGAGLVNVPGALTWNELATDDVATAKRFYSGLLGWTYEDLEGGPVPYSVIRNGERTNGGIRPQGPAEQAIPPNWAPYIAVESCTGASAAATELGGRVLMAPTEVPAGKFAAIADPQGAVFAVFEGDFDD